VRRARKQPAGGEAAGATVTERGDVFFFFRPKVERYFPRGERDVQRFLAVLAPDGRRLFRLVTVGRKRLPGASRTARDRNWGWVMKVGSCAEDVVDELRGYAYDTKTRGRRNQPAARPAGEGRYAIARHGAHAHLAYALAQPAAPGHVQRELGIEGTASFVVAVKNPWWPTPSGSPGGLAPEAEALFPQELQDGFRGRRWAPLEPGHLDREGAELVLVGTREDPTDLGIRLDDEPEDVRELFGLDPGTHPVAPLFDGEWA
jgi:hypothetical protein